MLPVQFGEINQIARVAEYVHSSLSENEGGEDRGGRGRGRRCLAQRRTDLPAGRVCLGFRFFDGNVCVEQNGRISR